jgi:cbb3-type cytochrome oxidase maturation protein
MTKIIFDGEQHHFRFYQKIVTLKIDMSVVIILMIMSILVAVVFLAAYLWSAKTGQFEDPEANANRILHDTELVKNNIINKHLN